ncbi:winged helix DNA-binding protein [Cohnella boryungensis]|uniref:Winged helix DNA-binding protein n=1 Tax=Cohnella boryungensis TaxID=768479 RepID=A0ABV8SH93_9BACL
MTQSNAQPLSRVQRQALEFIEMFIAKNGYSPSTRELASAMKYESSSTAHYLLERLERKGYISKEASGPRTIRLLMPIAPSGSDLNNEENRLRKENAILIQQLVVIAEVATEETVKGAARQTLRDIGVEIDK